MKRFRKRNLFLLGVLPALVIGGYAVISINHSNPVLEFRHYEKGNNGRSSVAVMQFQNQGFRSSIFEALSSYKSISPKFLVQYFENNKWGDTNEISNLPDRVRLAGAINVEVKPGETVVFKLQIPMSPYSSRMGMSYSKGALHSNLEMFAKLRDRAFQFIGWRVPVQKRKTEIVWCQKIIPPPFDIAEYHSPVSNQVYRPHASFPPAAGLHTNVRNRILPNKDRTVIPTNGNRIRLEKKFDAGLSFDKPPETLPMPSEEP